MLSGVVPATALYFGSYESGKRMLPADSGMVGDMLVGCYTQAIAGIVFTPVDIIKERMQVRYYSSFANLCMPCLGVYLQHYMLAVRHLKTAQVGVGCHAVSTNTAVSSAHLKANADLQHLLPCLLFFRPAI